ncbi:hypothetical protein [Streptomyces sp. PSKA30]|uniref:hypothetical protein n=1 Tax=Streptomyces sp. PSKA30 TaxID=2874597 RepID=UPI001CD11A56|nr:hypothetical protein [Streptomyces sp. PSKA30]MBZ9645616.1 hypothetical protein [Streptomyces sp. PSKA30]
MGERLPLPDGSLAGWTAFPFEGDFQAKPLQPPVLPEPARNGEGDPTECRTCRTPVTEALWADEHWRLDALGTQLRLPAAVMLQPRGHYDLPAERAAELGPLLQRVERAILVLDGVARVHINRWGDGGAHLHFWLMARPAGMLQLRGTFLPV